MIYQLLQCPALSVYYFTTLHRVQCMRTPLWRAPELIDAPVASGIRGIREWGEDIRVDLTAENTKIVHVASDGLVRRISIVLAGALVDFNVVCFDGGVEASLGCTIRPLPAGEHYVCERQEITRDTLLQIAHTSEP
jgi:hypothetical protein